MSFERSVIIPFQLYSKCTLPSKDTVAVDILTNETLPSDKKLKLYNQAVTAEKRASSPPPLPPPPPPSSLPDKRQHILHNIPDKDKPVVRMILDIVNENNNILDTNDNLELLIDEQVVSGSNIVNVLLYLTGNVPVTSDSDIPKGSHAFYDRLIQLGMPSIWIKTKLRSKKSKKRTSSRIAESEEKKKRKWTSID